jgi:hypothetical protein
MVSSSVMMVMVVMAMAGRERGAGKHHQEQGSSENLFHDPNVARGAEQKKGFRSRASKDAPVREALPTREDRMGRAAWRSTGQRRRLELR